MINFWDELSLPLRLDLTQNEIEAAFRDRSKASHPDAGGAQGDFERLREARNALLDSARRLELWLKIHDVELSHSGSIANEVAIMFARVGEVTAGVDAWSEKSVASGLGKALWQKEGWAWKERVESLQTEIGEWRERLENDFKRLQANAENGEFAEAIQVRNELGFLRKWQSELQARFGKIWEGLV
jgi:curved DNA-binding protein CbpA